MVKTFLGNIKGDKGEKGDPGATGEPGKDAVFHFYANDLANGLSINTPLAEYPTHNISVVNISTAHANEHGFPSAGVLFTYNTSVTYAFQVFKAYRSNLTMKRYWIISSWSEFENDMDAKFFLATIGNQNVTGTLNEPTVTTLAFNSGDTTQSVSANKITVEPGVWQVSVNTRFSPIGFADSLFIQLYVNETQELLINLPPTMAKEKSFTHIFKVTETSTVSLRTGKPSGSDTVGFSGTPSNKFTLAKIGGI